MSKIIVSVKLESDFENVRILASESQELNNPIYSPYYSTTNKMFKGTVDNLKANTQYYYGVEISGVLQINGRGMAKTFPQGFGDFTCAFASCAETGSNHTVFETIRNLNPNIFIHMGDLHYSDINEDNIQLYRDAYDAVFSSPRQSKLYSEIATAYMWDDHDFGRNNATEGTPGKNSAALAYRERVPHYALPEGNGAKPIYQSFVIGRVRFIMTDLRFNKTMNSLTDDVNKNMMSVTQYNWFKTELLKPEPFKVWVNTVPWIGSPVAGDDYWASYSTERKKIANFIKDNDLEGKVAIISGDMHALAIDDGTNSDYADGGGASIPVFQAASLDRLGSEKGGPFTYGPFVNSNLGNQYGIMNVTDDGGTSILIEWLAKRGTETIASHTFAVSGEAYSGVDITAPENPSNLTASNINDTSLTINWTKSTSGDVVSYEVYRNNVLIGSSVGSSYNVTGLSPQTQYTFKVVAVDDSDNKSVGATLNATTTGVLPHILMDGVDDLLLIPQIEFDEFEMKISAEPATGASTRYIDATNSVQYGDIQRYSDGTDRIGSGFSSVFVDGVAKTNATTFVPSNKIVTLKGVVNPSRKIAGGGTVGIFAKPSNGSNVKGKVYDVKFYLSGALIAHYDASTGTVQDQTGNGYNATLTGGIFS